MFEQDYIMRLVNEIARVIAKVLFNINSDTLEEELENRIEDTDLFDHLLDMIDEGHINEAENLLDDMLDDKHSNCIETALLFYTYLNDKSDEFLKENNYTRDEIKYGIESIAHRVGLKDFVRNLFI